MTRQEKHCDFNEPRTRVRPCYRRGDRIVQRQLAAGARLPNLGTFVTEEIKAVFFVEKESGLVKQVRVEIKKGMPANMQTSGGMEMDFRTSYRLTVTGRDPESDVIVPSRVEKLLSD